MWIDLLLCAVVLTAAHCVVPGNGGAAYSKWAYVPQYYNGTAPYGMWTFSRAFVW